MDVQGALARRMDFLVARQAVVAGNIANADTPGYLAKDLVAAGNSASGNRFAMMVTNAKHVSGGSASARAGGRVVEDTRFIQHNGNSVRLDLEMMNMRQVQGDYRMMTQLYTKQASLQAIALGKK